MHGELVHDTRLRRAQVDALELVLGGGDAFLELGDLALRLAQIPQHLGAKVLVDLDDLQFGLADLAARAGDIGDELAALALQPRLIALQLHVARNGDKIFLVEIGNPDKFRPDELELVFFCRQLRRQAANLFIELGDAFAQLRALPRPCRPSRFEQLLLAGERHGH